ncbi:YbdK family carboxylate-amine ligase [Streptomyces sp. NBC_00539]|uniref:YbdK family carboxylate-amine ligase n=1 Tax=Streptomyces sp. NBC_00539 TaxID=2975770 RepID=UPI002E811AF2|nr:YbdK family carboxylate-amine ligase [Streptomyces sp. NBC_00539]WUC63079.1 YbdK family carboxylate-amine ligase [Streptomyces sp. NBC_00539]
MDASEAKDLRHGQSDPLAPTVGVEEEFFLVGAGSRIVQPAAARVVARAAATLGDDVSGEFTDFQIETRTPPCTSVSQLHRELLRLRAGIARAAAAEGLKVCPSGTPVLRPPGPAPIGTHPRYRAGADLFRSMMDDYVINALHVHVHLPDRDLAVQVSNHLRPWLPLLVEMSANSPFCEGRDTGYASWRSVIRLRFPALGPPPYARSFEEYGRHAEAMAEAGGMSFADLPFWDVRPHPQLPTVEVRCMDVPADPADSAALAAITRALVVTAADAASRGEGAPHPSAEWLRCAYWNATRDGWSGHGPDALTGQVLPAPVRGARLLEHVRPALEEHGDTEPVTALLRRLESRGSGAHRQRAASRLPGGLAAVVDDLTAAPPQPPPETTPTGPRNRTSPDRRVCDGAGPPPVSAWDPHDTPPLVSARPAGAELCPVAQEGPVKQAPTLHDRPHANDAVTDALRRDGYARYRAADLEPDTDARRRDLAEIESVFATLPPDPYAPHTNRFRRYSHAVYLPWTGQLSFTPGAPDPTYGMVTEYWQDDHNPEFPDVRRRLPDLPTTLHGNALLQRLIDTDLHHALWLEDLQRTPVYVGVHLLKLAVHASADTAVSSPNSLHQDGGSPATFTFAHFIGSTNIRGGENVIATPESAGRQPDDLPETAVHARFTLNEPLDGYAVHDHRVSHYVGPVSLGDGTGPGERRILIIGLAPYGPRL